MAVQVLFSWQQTSVLAKIHFWPTYLVDLGKVLNCRLALAGKISLCGCNGHNVMRLKILWTATKLILDLPCNRKAKLSSWEKKKKSSLKSVLSYSVKSLWAVALRRDLCFVCIPLDRAHGMERSMWGNLCQIWCHEPWLLQVKGGGL